MDINVTINCPDLLMAATTLAKAFTCRCHAHNESETPQAEAFNAPAANATPNSTAVPTTAAPQITGALIAKAGADLIGWDSSALGPLNALLQKYGVTCAQDLKPNQLDAFATDMRSLGAKI